MEDETLNNILNILKNTTNNTNTPSSNNNDLQSLLIKFLLSGGLNQIMNIRNQNSTSQTTEQPKPEQPRKIDLANYQRLD